MFPHTAAIDAYYSYGNGTRKELAPKPSIQLAPLVRKIIDELEIGQSPGYTDAVFQLLELSCETQRELETKFDDCRRLVRRDGKPHDVTAIANNGKLGVTFVATKIAGFQANCEKLGSYIDRKLQSTGADSWVGLISVVGEPKLVHAWTLAIPATNLTNRPPGE